MPGLGKFWKGFIIGNFYFMFIVSLNDGYLTIIELTMRPCVWQPTPKTADVTKIVGSRESVICFRIFAFIVFTLRPLC